ncbi:MAG: heterodisulfide reductase-related iron-sulfur binding cluster, partial [Planctomycetota bacterium]
TAQRAGALASAVAATVSCEAAFTHFAELDALLECSAAIDERHDGDVRKLTQEETARVMDACFQCKLCEVQCPYTPRDGHEFKLDFPKLVHRFRAQRTAREGLRMRERLLGDPDLAGKLARMSFGVANRMNRVSAHRWFLEKVLGVHREKLLPDFASTSFEAWAARTGKLRLKPGGEALLYQTCYVQNNEPEIGRDTLEVLEKNQVDVGCLRGLECCGMPAWEHGDLKTLQAHAKHNLDLLMPHVDAGSKVLAINPTCSMMMRREYPELVAAPDRERAKRLAAAVMDPCEYLWSIRNEPRFHTEVRSRPGESIAYHAPCHLRAQAVGFKGRDLLRKVLGVTLANVQECCGHDGTFAMTVEGFEPSQRIGQRAFEGVKSADAEIWATDCPLAAIQFAQHAGKKPMHPMTILARAFRENGFGPGVSREATV